MTSMWQDMKRDMKWALAIAGLVMGYAFCGDASAQVITQPVYTRPAKGQVIVTFNATVSPSTVATQAYDWTAFSSANVSLKLANATGNRCSCPSGTNNCEAAFSFGFKTSTSKTGPFGEVTGMTLQFPVQYNPSSPATEPAVFSGGQYNIGEPFVQFNGAFTSYMDTGTGLQVAGCFLSITVTPIPFTNRQTVEGPYTTVVASTSSVQPVVMGGFGYDPPGGSGQGTFLYVPRVNPQGVIAVGPGSGAPILPATTPITVGASPAAGTLIYTSVIAQRSVRLQNVGTFPVVCAAGTNAASVSTTRYSFVLAAGSVAGDGTGGDYTVEQLPTGNTDGRIYCVGNGGAGSVAILPQ